MQKSSGKEEKIKLFRMAFTNGFLLFIYLVFIIVLLGFMLNWGNSNALAINLTTLIFRNIYFNLNIILFLGVLLYTNRFPKETSIKLEVFNRRHILLHISIILGALIQLSILPRLNVDNSAITSVIVILPFIGLKWFFERE